MVKPIVKSVQSTDGTKIYADAVGNSTNPALIFVHGFSSSATVFDNIFSSTVNSEEFYLVRYDVRGHGRSGKPNAEGHGSQRYAEDFTAVTKAFGVKNPIFIGWSIGGNILADIAANLPSDAINGAVCIAGTPYAMEGEGLYSAAMSSTLSGLLSSDNVLASNQAALAANRLLFYRDPNPPEDFLEDTIRANAEGADFCDENPAISWETRCACIGMASLISPAERMLIASRPRDNTRILELARGGFPLLVIYGTHDGYMSGEKVVEILRPSFVNLEVKVIEGGSHAPFLETPDEIMDIIFKFGKRVTKQL